MSDGETRQFIRATFRSVWSLELLLLLRGDPDKVWPRDELIERLRASDLVVEQSVQSLEAAGLVAMRRDGGVRYAASAPDLERCMIDVAALYTSSPHAVRRLIVAAAADPAASFADAFRLRRGD